MSAAAVNPSAAPALNPGDVFIPQQVYGRNPMPEAIGSCRDLSDAAKFAWMHLAWRAGEDGKCYPSSERDLGRRWGWEKRKAQRAVAELQEYGLIRRTKRFSSNGVQRSSAIEFIWHQVYERPKVTAMPGTAPKERRKPAMPTAPKPKPADHVPASNMTVPSVKSDSTPVSNMTQVKRNVLPPLSEEERETAKEEEYSGVTEVVRANEPTPPPPPGLDSQKSEPEPAAEEAKRFIAGHIGEFLSGYPGGGGPSKAIEEALKAWQADGSPPIEEWWQEVLASKRAFASYVHRSQKKPKDACYWFADGYHKRKWPGSWRDTWETPDYPRKDSDQMDWDEEAKRLAESARKSGTLLSMPDTSWEQPDPPRQRTKTCHKCAGEGRIDAPLPYEMVKNQAFTTAYLMRWAKDNGTECDACKPADLSQAWAQAFNELDKAVNP